MLGIRGLNGAFADKTFKAGERFTEPDFVRKPVEYLYTDGSAFHFMDQQSYALRGVALHLVRMRGKEAFASQVRDLYADRSVHVRALAAAAIVVLISRRTPRKRCCSSAHSR